MKHTSVIATAVAAIAAMSSISSAASYMSHEGRTYQMLPTVTSSIDMSHTMPLDAVTVGTPAAAYTQTSTAGLLLNSTFSPDGLDDVGLAPGTAAARPILTNLSAGYARSVAVTTATTAVVFVDFWNVVDPLSTGPVESSYIGGFGGTLNVPTGAANSAAAFSFSSLNTLTTPIAFTDDNIGVEITYANSAGTVLSTILTNLSSNPGVPTLGSSVLGYYRDADANGDFQATDLQATLGNLYLSMSTAAAVPEPTSLAALAGAGVLGFRRRRA